MPHWHLSSSFLAKNHQLAILSQSSGENILFSQKVLGIDTRVLNTKSKCTIRRFIIIGVQLFFIGRKHFLIGHFFMQQCGTSGAFISWLLFSLAACPPSKHSKLVNNCFLVLLCCGNSGHFLVLFWWPLLRHRNASYWPTLCYEALWH